MVQVGEEDRAPTRSPPDLRHAGYSDKEGQSPMGSYRLLK